MSEPISQILICQRELLPARTTDFVQSGRYQLSYRGILEYCNAVFLKRKPEEHFCSRAFCCWAFCVLVRRHSQKVRQLTLVDFDRIVDDAGVASDRCSRDSDPVHQIRRSFDVVGRIP